MTNREFVEGINIIAKYMPIEDSNGHNIANCSDQIWFGNENWVTKESERQKLEDLGFFISENSWSAFL